MTGEWSRRDLMRRGGLALGGGLAAASAVSGCGQPASGGSYAEGTDTLARAQKAGVISVGIANEKPYGFTDPRGRATGESVEVAHKILTTLGIPEIQAVTVDFGELIAGLTLARQFDMIAAGLTITRERCEAVAFSIPDYTVDTALLVPRDNPKHVYTFEQVRDDQDIRIAVLGGAVEREYAVGYNIPDARILRVADQEALLGAVTGNRAYCAALSTVSLRALTADHPEAEVDVTPGFRPKVGGSPAVSAGAFAFRPGEDDILNEVNGKLRELQQSGEWLRIAQSWGFGLENVPRSDPSTESLCAEQPVPTSR